MSKLQTNPENDPKKHILNSAYKVFCTDAIYDERFHLQILALLHQITSEKSLIAFQ